MALQRTALLVLAGGGVLRGRSRIVAMTANAGPDSMAECRAAGMEGYLVKPFVLEHLRAELEVLVAERGPEGRAPVRD